MDLAARLAALSRSLVNRGYLPHTVREGDDRDAFALASDCVDEAHSQYLLGRLVRAFTEMDEATTHLRRAELTSSDPDFREAEALWEALADLAYPEDIQQQEASV